MLFLPSSAEVHLSESRQESLEQFPSHACPYCGECVTLAQLQQPAGIGGGTYCPKCWGRVYLSNGFEKYLGLLCVGIAFVVVWFFVTKVILRLLVGTMLVAFLLWLQLLPLSTRFVPASLRRWRERKYKTFHEWLQERNSPPTFKDQK